MKTNEMAPHFRKAVLEIDSDIAGLQQDIARLQITRGTIVELYGGESDIPAVQTIGAPRAKAARGDSRPTIKKAKTGGASAPVAPGAAPEGFGRAPSADTVKLMATARTAAEPFTAPSLSVASGFARVFCTNKLNAWLEKGWLERAGRGEFKRTATFPKEAPTEAA